MGDKPNVLADVVLCIWVHTEGKSGNIKNINLSDAANDGSLEGIIDSVNSCEEIQNALAEMTLAAFRHHNKYPETKIQITPCFALKELEDII